ncbi:protein of unknown function [Modestobacter italicus]|uniref:Uncharacterized protein n=1 Tax=Modestobacter italicus (strain DSM 44449 / CECT 9708 / BC 501) TaxID=2732864 RepID=I4F0R4_MODI5|nr:protein of unknown function [Modestobacter marinus]
MLCAHHASPSWQGTSAPEAVNVHLGWLYEVLEFELSTAEGCGAATAPPLSTCTTQRPCESYGTAHTSVDSDW